MQADHRPEHAQSWHPTPHGLPDNAVAISAAAADLPQPCWLLTQPQALSLIKSKPGLPEHPYYQGQLRLLAGPHRIEAGWWDDTPTERDYYLASSERAGLLWIFRDRHPDPSNSLRSPWFLHGLFA
jgi:protein ImuB